MPWLKKETGGSTVLGYTWAHNGDVVCVSHEHAVTLLRIPDGGYTEVDGPETAPDTFSEVVYDKPTTGKTVSRGRRPDREAQ